MAETKKANNRTAAIRILPFFLFIALFSLALIILPTSLYSGHKSPFVIPLEGEIITGFRQSYFIPGEQKYLKHTGIDIKGKFGQKVAAAGNGIVAYTGFSPIGGRTLVIRHNDKIRTTYLNLMAIYVATGTYVRQGEAVACIGASDDPSGESPHLHFGVIYDNKYIDPEGLLKIDYSTISRFIYPVYLNDDFDFNMDI
jgi:murein DD-endopeptidase MepM/ murein hydrolase activator NlpD